MNSEEKDSELRRYWNAIGEFQEHCRVSPEVGIEDQVIVPQSLRSAANNAPNTYADYLTEALECYTGGQYRAAVLMTWSAVIQHLYSIASNHKSGITLFESANQQRFGKSNSYRPIRKADDFLYLREAQFIQLGEDAGMYNRNTRRILEDRLKLRNLCGHPTQYRPGQEEVIVFIESLMLNILGGNLLNW